MVHRFEVEEGNPKAIHFAVHKDTGVAIVQADVSSMKLFVWETETPTEKTATGGETLTVSDCVFNTMQEWDRDDDGYNVRIVVSGSYLSDANKTYRVEVKITPASGEAYYLDPVELRTTAMFST